MCLDLDAGVWIFPVLFFYYDEVGLVDQLRALPEFILILLYELNKLNLPNILENGEYTQIRHIKNWLFMLKKCISAIK